MIPFAANRAERHGKQALDAVVAGADVPVVAADSAAAVVVVDTVVAAEAVDVLLAKCMMPLAPSVECKHRYHFARRLVNQFSAETVLENKKSPSKSEY